MPVDLDGAVPVTELLNYDLDALRSERSYFPREPRTNIDRIAVPPGLKERCWSFAVDQFGEDVAAALAGNLDADVAADFFVIHDTAGTTEYGRGPGLTDPGGSAAQRGIHLWLSARATYRQRDWERAGYGTKMEMGAENHCFLHTELSRDRDLLATQTYYNDSQYKRLACAYLFASSRTGRFLTVTSHNEVDRACCIFDDAAGRFRDFGHHDPEKFDLGKWYTVVASIGDLPADSTFGIEPRRVDGRNLGGQKNVFVGYAKGDVDEVDQYGSVPWITSANSDAARHKKVRHPSYGEYYDLPITVTVGGVRKLPREA